MRWALLGGLLGAMAPLGLATVAAGLNPWFLDEPLSFGLLCVVPPVVLGALGGLLASRRGRAQGPGRRLTLALGVDLLLLALLAFRPMPPPVDGVKLLVVGIDGAGWTELDALELPVLEALQARGSRGVLHSAEPMFSPLLWTTMATGKTPDEHGIRGFRTRADQARAARVWEIAGEAGLSVGLYKWLVTWPPVVPEAGGFVVPAWLAPTPETVPERLSWVKELELSRRLKRRRIQEVRPGWRLALAGIPSGLRWSTLRTAAAWSLRERLGRPDPDERAWRLQLLRVAIDRDVFVAELHRSRPQLATFTTYAPDALGHTHWSWLEDCPDGAGAAGCPPWAEAVPDSLRQADAVLGELLASVGPDTVVLVLSDHGFRAMGAGDAGRYFAPTTERLRARLVAQVGPVDVARVGHKLALTMLGPEPQAQLQAVQVALAGWTQASTGAPFYRVEPIEGSGVALGLTLAREEVDAELLATDTVGGEPLADYARLTEAYSGEHHRQGIWLAAGPGVPQGRVGPYELLDVAPTILALLGLPAAQDMPGEVRLGVELPRVESYDALAPAREALVELDEVNQEMLEALGYLDGGEASEGATPRLDRQAPAP